TRPPATRIDNVTDVVHGTRIVDPYRWLENGDSPEVQRWVEAQNAYTHKRLDAYPDRAAVHARLRMLLSIGTVGVPQVRNGRYFHTRREGADENQPILYVRDGLTGQDRVLFDPNRLRADGTAALDWWYPSEDGTLLAYGVSEAGDEKSTLRILDVATGKARPDVIPQTRYCSLAWLPDDSGFYYTRYPAPGTVPAGEENYNSHLFFHTLGAESAADPEVFGKGRKPTDMIQVSLSPDGRWLVVMVFEGWSRSDLYLLDRRSDAHVFVPVAEGIDALFTGQVVGSTLYITTNDGAPRYKLLAVDAEQPGREHWTTLIPERDAVLIQAEPIGGRFVTLYLKDAASRVEVHGADGALVRDVPLPALGTVGAISGRYDGREAFFDFSSFTVPPLIERHDLDGGTTAPWERVKADLDLSAMEVRQVFYPSKDGTRISMFLVHRKGLKRDGSTPTLLYGYGGFNINLTPAFSRGLVLWLERGGLYAEPNLRGGGEYGEAWHRAGMLEHKQSVFDDFIAAAEWLIANKYTRPNRLAIKGGSNGGLLVGAALTQRPDLFGAVLCAVPLLDMVRYDRFQIARLWIPEYGSSESAEQFRWLYAYSPYHHVRPKTAYPAVLLTTADSDSRVDPMHARKMAARLQAATSSSAPILLRTETRAGHGIGKPLGKVIEEETDGWSFLLWRVMGG
ncbi:MAG TPA: prolyl oligopeptidase family serine peptidase, partial [Candidatus Polarisedimenticolia bacterium]|nr:prolyl oligopeptidase family serine peptidase [Candidatus Polarisedimenticolia bacterium]